MEWKRFRRSEKYEVSDTGLVRDTSNGTVIPQQYNDGGYLEVTLQEAGIVKTFLVHRMVAESFLAQPLRADQWIVNHRDRKRDHNCLGNLEWVSPAGNAVHASRSKADQWTSPYVGVYLHKGSGKFEARITWKGRKLYLGQFTDPLEAAKAWDKRCWELRHDLSLLNFPEDYKQLPKAA